MKKLIFLSTALVGLILTPAAFAGDSCSASSAKAVETAQADGSSCSTEKAIQVAQVDGASCSSAKATTVALADSASCSTEKAIVVAQADDASCSTAKATKVALADGASCEASSKAIQVAQKTDCETECETSCDDQTENIVLAQADTKASAEECGSCDEAKSAPAVASKSDDAAVVVAAQE